MWKSDPEFVLPPTVNQLFRLVSNTVIGTLAVDGWAVIFGTARPLLAVPNVTAHSATASVPIAVKYGRRIAVS